MGKKFTRKSAKRVKVKLTPKEANEIIRQEFIDSKGNKHINIIRFEPQKPFEPDFKQTVEYRKNNND